MFFTDETLVGMMYRTSSSEYGHPHIVDKFSSPFLPIQLPLPIPTQCQICTRPATPDFCIGLNNPRGIDSSMTIPR